MTITAPRHSSAIVVPVVKVGGALVRREFGHRGQGRQQSTARLRWSPSQHIAQLRSAPSRAGTGEFAQAAAAGGSQNPNNAFERPWVVGGPRLPAAEASCPAAQLGR